MENFDSKVQSLISNFSELDRPVSRMPLVVGDVLKFPKGSMRIHTGEVMGRSFYYLKDIEGKTISVTAITRSGNGLSFKHNESIAARITELILQNEEKDSYFHIREIKWDKTPNGYRKIIIF